MNAMAICGLVVTAVSFWGLCALIRHRFDIDGAVAPFISACGVMITLMLGGMLGILKWVHAALCIGGAAGFIYCYPVRQKRPDWLSVIVLAAALVYGLIRFDGVYLSGSDTVSHWGMTAKYLLVNDRFPDMSTELVYFHSYPLGTACFIYFFSRLSGMSEGMFLCAQFMLNVMAFLPSAALVRKNRLAGYFLALVAFLFMVTYNVGMNTLQVDTLLALMATGATAAVFCHRENAWCSAWIGITAAVALVFVKTSGVFFSTVIALFVLYSMISCGQRPDWRRILKIAVIFIAAIALAFVVWNGHVKIAYGSASDTKHAVSLTNYAQAFRAKLSSGLIVTIARKMARRLLHPKRLYRLMLLAAMAVFSGTAVAIGVASPDKKKWWKALFKTAGACIALYAVWYAMLYFMYVFSMPADEAQRLASITRYEKTMQLYIMGIVLMFVLNFFCGIEVFKMRYGRMLAVCASVVCALGLLTVAEKGNLRIIKKLTSGTKISGAHKCVRVLRDNYDIEDEKRYIILTRYNKRSVQNAHYLIKYEFMSNDIMMIMGGISLKGFDPEGHYTFQNTVPFDTEWAPTEDIAATLWEYADDYDYIFVLDEDPAFESAINTFLESYGGDTPVMYGYE